MNISNCPVDGTAIQSGDGDDTVATIDYAPQIPTKTTVQAIVFNYRPKRSLAKVIFSQASVILLTEGGVWSLIFRGG